MKQISQVNGTAAGRYSGERAGKQCAAKGGISMTKNGAKLSGEKDREGEQ
ncbi:hypothetical protein Q8G35_02040 [Peribacillus simplex]|uniref:Uncharacterized protein n=2 Tax=Peribacillus TaxID=2675229 RepID=A0AA90PAV5_9BACI|nr:MULTISPECIES: hypothetical protein [Peribacillus]MDP1417182.1 hypothetical protein [Peribacillus simplex]MDP1449837.1 hypothetical protein [Peribacillus frigoritolerans]